MIPKVIHYCWFGGNPLPPKAEKCIKSWKKYCPDYEIVRWDESNFDVNCNDYCREMYAQKKWAFLTDYIRLKVVYENGGIYLDTDVELIKPLDKLLDNSAYMGLETTDKVATGLGFGAEKNHEFIRKNMEYYENWKPSDPIETCPVITSRLLEPHGVDCTSTEVQHIQDLTIYPVEYFCAKHLHTGETCITPNTYSIHHFEASWNNKEQLAVTKKRWRKYRIERIKKSPKILLRKLIGDSSVESIKRFLHRK
jgi:mannosyltransferase OCH1-like enzyme